MKLIFTFLFLGLFACTYGQLPDSIARKVDAVFAEYDKTNSPGCALAILKDGKTIYKRGYGMSNLEYNIAITPGSIFHIASISKQFAAAALIRLSLEGKLSLDDDVRKYIPEVPDFGHTITFKHLIHHTSGIRDQWALQALSGWRGDDLITEKDIMNTLSRQKELNFLPGEEYVYCNTGFTLAAVAVKKITGVSLRDYADSVFFKPLGMDDTHFHSDHAEITPNRTSAYVKDERGVWKVSIPVYDTYGATSLFTTVEDLAKWDENFYTKKVGGDAFIDLMQKTGVLNNKTPQTYAGGLVVSRYKGHRTVGHSGADAGYRSNMTRFPDEHFTVVVLANLANINAASVVYKVADIFLRDKGDQQPAVIVDSSLVKQWAGDYFDADRQMFMRLIYRNGKLNTGVAELNPTGNNSFLVGSTSSTMKFSGDPRDAKLETVIEGEGLKTFKRVNKMALPPSALEEYKGSYYSSELDIRYTILTKDSSLVLQMPKKDDGSFDPILKDVFANPANAVVRFRRNKKGTIEGLYLSIPRARNLYFEKMVTR